MEKTRSKRLFIFSVGIFIGCSDFPTSQIIDQPLKVILRVRDNNLEKQLYVIQADGSELFQLTSGESTKSDAAWSPDGSKIVFTDDRGGRRTRFFHDIHIINTDGTGEVNLTDTPDIHESQPTWSPDGQHITYLSSTFLDEVNSDPGIYVMDINGSNKKNLTPGINLRSTPYPAWSPDGSQIAFINGNMNSDDEIWVMNADGTSQKNLTPDNGRNFHHVWSQDGSKIAFASSRNGGEEIFVMNADGSNQIRFTNWSDGHARRPSWSADGTKIAYEVSKRISGANFAMNIFVVDAVTKEKNQLTDLGDNFGPSWSPDGTKIAFYSIRDASSGVHIMNVDGSGATPLTDLQETNQLRISWSPVRR